MITVVGLLAGALTTGAWLPQIWRTWRTGSAGDLSWHYLGVMSAGIGTWLTYGLLSGDVAVIATNVGSATLLAVLLVLKARTTAPLPELLDVDLEPADLTVP